MSTSASISADIALENVFDTDRSAGTRGLSYRFNGMGQSSQTSGKPKKLAMLRTISQGPQKKMAGPLSPFEKIKLESDRTTAHGHPVILPTEYGEFGPVFDVIALYQNAVKRQVLVAYNMLEALLRYKYEVTHAETGLFFNWFDTVEDSVLTLLTVEEEVVFPFLDEQGVVLPPVLQTSERQKVKDLIANALGNITENVERIELMPAGESVSKISKVLGPFLKTVVEYFERQRDALPKAIISADIGGSSETQLRVRFMRALKAKENAATYIAFVSHWLSNAQLKQWKSQYLGPMRGMRYEQWARKFAMTHQEIPVTMMERLNYTESTTPQSHSNSNLSAYFTKKRRTAARA